MSRKQPEIRIVYPDASAAAMLLTEAMIKRASGKRIVETESSEREYTGQELFAGALACKTDTSVELTLRLNPDAMDYALTTLIAKNLTEDERNSIRKATDSMELDALLSPAQAAEAPGQAPDGGSSTDVSSAAREAATQSGKQEKQIEVGKIPDKELREILRCFARDIDNIEELGEDAFQTELSNIIETTIKEIDHRAGVIDLDETATQSGEPEFVKVTKETLLDILNDYRDKLQSGCGTFDANEGAVHRIMELFSRAPEKPNANPELEIRLAVLVAYAATFTTKKAATNHYQALQEFATETAKRITDGKDGHPFLSKIIQNATLSLQLDKQEKPKVLFHAQMSAYKGEREIYSPGENRADRTDRTDEAESDIEPGLLNDIEDGTEGGEE